MLFRSVFDEDGRNPFQFETLHHYQQQNAELLAMPDVFPDRFFHNFATGESKMTAEAGQTSTKSSIVNSKLNNDNTSQVNTNPSVIHSAITAALGPNNSPVQPYQTPHVQAFASVPFQPDQSSLECQTRLPLQQQVPFHKPTTSTSTSLASSLSTSCFETNPTAYFVDEPLLRRCSGFRWLRISGRTKQSVVNPIINTSRILQATMNSSHDITMAPDEPNDRSTKPQATFHEAQSVHQVSPSSDAVASLTVSASTQSASTPNESNVDTAAAVAADSKNVTIAAAVPTMSTTDSSRKHIIDPGLSRQSPHQPKRNPYQQPS